MKRTFSTNTNFTIINKGDKELNIPEYKKSQVVSMSPLEEEIFQTGDFGSSSFYYENTKKIEEVEVDGLYTETKDGDFTFTTIPADYEELDESDVSSIINRDAAAFKFTNITKTLQDGQIYATSIQENDFNIGDTVILDGYYYDNNAYVVQPDELVKNNEGELIQYFIEYDHPLKINLYIVEKVDGEYVIIDKATGKLNSLHPVKVQINAKEQYVKYGDEELYAGDPNDTVIFEKPLFGHEYKIDLIPSSSEYVAYSLVSKNAVGNVNGKYVRPEELRSGTKAYFFEYREMSTFHKGEGEEFTCKILKNDVEDGDIIPHSGEGIAMSLFTHHDELPQNFECVFNVNGEEIRGDYEMDENGYYCGVSSWHGDEVVVSCVIREKITSTFINSPESNVDYELYHFDNSEPGYFTWVRVYEGDVMTVGDSYKITGPDGREYPAFDNQVDLTISDNYMGKIISVYYFTLSTDMISEGVTEIKLHSETTE